MRPLGLFITAADVLIALGLTSSLMKAEGKPTHKHQQQTTRD